MERHNASLLAIVSFFAFIDNVEMTEMKRSVIEVLARHCHAIYSKAFKAPKNLFFRSFFDVTICKFDDDREVGREATGFEVSSNLLLANMEDNKCGYGKRVRFEFTRNWLFLRVHNSIGI